VTTLRPASRSQQVIAITLSGFLGRNGVPQINSGRAVDAANTFAATAAPPINPKKNRRVKRERQECRGSIGFSQYGQISTSQR